MPDDPATSPDDDRPEADGSGTDADAASGTTDAASGTTDAGEGVDEAGTESETAAETDAAPSDVGVDAAGSDTASNEDVDSDTTDSHATDSAAASNGEARSGATANGEANPGAASNGHGGSGGGAAVAASEVPPDVRKYARFKKVDGAQYERVNQFLRDRTYVTAREWAIARLCADFRTETGVEMTKIGENLPELVPFMTDTYTPQAVNQARSSFEEKVRKAGATFLYGAMCGFFTAEELDEMMYEVTEIAKFLLEVEGVDLSVEEELEAEERISTVMREVREASADLRRQEVESD